MGIDMEVNAEQGSLPVHGVLAKLVVEDSNEDEQPSPSIVFLALDR